VQVSDLWSPKLHYRYIWHGCTNWQVHSQFDLLRCDCVTLAILVLASLILYKTNAVSSKLIADSGYIECQDIPSYANNSSSFEVTPRDLRLVQSASLYCLCSLPWEHCPCWSWLLKIILGRWLLSIHITWPVQRSVVSRNASMPVILDISTICNYLLLLLMLCL